MLKRFLGAAIVATAMLAAAALGQERYTFDVPNVDGQMDDPGAAGVEPAPAVLPLAINDGPPTLQPQQPAAMDDPADATPEWPSSDEPIYLSYWGRHGGYGHAWSGHVSYALGYKSLESAWQPADNQFVFGVFDFDVRPPLWPVSIAVQALFSYSDTVPGGQFADQSNTYELNLGLREVIPTPSIFEPFVGGGVSILGASVSQEFQDRFGNFFWREDGAATVGFWAGVGTYIDLNEYFHLGVEVQYTYGRVGFDGRHLNAGGIEALAMVGFHW